MSELYYVQSFTGKSWYPSLCPRWPWSAKPLRGS